MLAGTPSGVFESVDGGGHWTHVTPTRGWGVANSFAFGTIGAQPYVLIGTNAGLGNVPLPPSGAGRKASLLNETWALIPSPPGSAAWRTNTVSVAEYRHGARLPSSVVAGCLWPGHSGGVVHIATLLNRTAAAWEVQRHSPCQAMALDPRDADHMLVNNASNGLHVHESSDGGKTYHSCHDYRGAVMVAIDRKGWLYGASEGGALRNVKGCGPDGKWEPYFVRRTARRTGTVRDRTAHDYQRINLDFAGGVAFGSDQGMFIQNGTELQLISANGDVNNNIVRAPAPLRSPCARISAPARASALHSRHAHRPERRPCRARAELAPWRPTPPADHASVDSRGRSRGRDVHCHGAVGLVARRLLGLG